jgi:hypothetical protein
MISPHCCGACIGSAAGELPARCTNGLLGKARVLRNSTRGRPTALHRQYWRSSVAGRFGTHLRVPRPTRNSSSTAALKRRPWCERNPSASRNPDFLPRHTPFLGRSSVHTCVPAPRREQGQNQVSTSRGSFALTGAWRPLIQHLSGTDDRLRGGRKRMVQVDFLSGFPLKQELPEVI